MALQFSTDGEQVIHRIVEDAVTASSDDGGYQWQEFFEIDRCSRWILDGNYRQVALQFPDKYLPDAVPVSQIIQDRTKAEVFVLADTSYGSCCVDEVAASHYSAEALIHFGHSCLSLSDRLPTLCIFGKGAIDLSDCCTKLKNNIAASSKVLVTLDVKYNHIKDDIQELLSQHFSKVLIPDVSLPCDNLPQQTSPNLSTEVAFRLYNRHFALPSGDCMANYTILHIGRESMFLTNMMLAFPDCTFYLYDPKAKTCQKQGHGISKLLMKRFYLVEKIKDAQIVGILVATLSVAHYLEIMERIKVLLKHAGKKYFVFSVGKINIAKLSNFPDVDVFVLVSCPESIILDSSEYYHPIVTPYEVELACNPERQWTGKIISDYLGLLPGGANYQRVDLDKPLHEMDVSLISGKVRRLGTTDDSSGLCEGNTVAVKDSMTVAPVIGDRFSGKSWHGLDPQLGQTEVTKVVEGRKGIAVRYEDEPS